MGKIPRPGTDTSKLTILWCSGSLLQIYMKYKCMTYKRYITNTITMQKTLSFSLPTHTDTQNRPSSNCHITKRNAKIQQSEVQSQMLVLYFGLWLEGTSYSPPTYLTYLSLSIFWPSDHLLFWKFAMVISDICEVTSSGKPELASWVSSYKIGI